SAEFPPAAVGTLVAEKPLESPPPATAERAARQQDGRSLASPLKTPPAATAAPTGDAPADGKEQGPTAKASAPARSPLGIDAKPDLAAAEKVAPQSLAETPLPGADTQVRVLAPSTPDRDEVAFAVQLKAMPAPEE